MVGMINCVVLERSTFWQTIGLLKAEMDTPCSREPTQGSKRLVDLSSS
jgi:hypothetical protein